MSMATGRDADASRLLAQPPAGVGLVIPQVCVMEALSVLNQDRRQRNQFKDQLEFQIGQLRRDTTSTNARALVAHLQQAKFAHDDLIEEVGIRLFYAIRLTGQNATLISVTGQILDDSRANPLIEDPTDNLILYCILSQARSHPVNPKVFLSGNSKDFGVESVQHALRTAGVNKSSRAAKQFLEWFTSQVSRDDLLRGE